MIALRRSWLFILASLLVRLGHATVPTDDRVTNKVYRRDGQAEPDAFVAEVTPMSRKNVAAIVVCVIAGILLSLAALGWCLVAKRAKVPLHDEEGATGLGKGSSLKSEFSPDGKHVRKQFERIRRAFSRHKKQKHGSILPVHRGHLSSKQMEAIGRPLPVVPAPAHHHPGSLERQHRKVPRRVPPPPIDTSPECPYTSDSTSSYSPSMSSSDGSHESTEPLKKTQAAAAKPDVVRIPGRPLPGFSGAKTAQLRPPKSPSRRKSWLSKQPLKHPFAPLRTSDASLRFPPGSPLIQYHPARHHLEARLGPRTPRTPGPSPLSTSLTPRDASNRDSLRRQVLEEESSTRQAKLVGALHSTAAEGKRTPTGYRGALPSIPSKDSPSSSTSRASHRGSDPPTSAYI